MKTAQKSELNPNFAGRVYSINFCNIGEYEKNTIEFRLPNGTVDENVWIQNINLFGGIVKTAEDLALIQSKPIEKLSEEDKMMLKCFETIKNPEVSESKKLESLLEMVIPEENRDIYKERYDVNSKLIEKDFMMQNEVVNKISKKTIDLNKIGKKVFIGEDAVTGQEYNYGVQIIERDLDRVNSEKTLD